MARTDEPHATQETLEPALTLRSRRWLNQCYRLNRIGPRTTTSHLINMNAVIYRNQFIYSIEMGCPDIGWLPPHRLMLEQLMRQFTFQPPFRGIQQLLIATLDNDTHPIMVINYFVCFNTDPWVGTHPIDLLTPRGETVEMSFVISEIDRHDVRLIVARTSQSAKPQVCQRLNAFFICQFKN